MLVDVSSPRRGPDRRRRIAGRALLASAGVVGALAISACGSSSSKTTSTGSNTSTGGSSSGKTVKVALILKTFSNPYFVSMEKSAKADAASKGVDLTVTAGSTDGDTATQITSIENAVTAGDKGIIITPNGNAVNAALVKARQAGLFTIALDTAPIPASTVDLTYATNNTEAGTLIGKWAAAKFAGKSADIAMLDLFNDQVVSVDIDRDHGFLQGMGIPVGNANLNGKEPTSGNYTGGKGGTYKIACQLPTQGAVATGKSAMQTCLQKDPNINLVYAINEPAAEGAAEAIKAAGSKATVVAIDGGCTNLPFIENGEIAATAGQYPGKMASDGIDAIVKYAETGTKQTATPGLGFFNTGTQLYTDQPQAGVPSITAAAAKSICWG